MEEPPDSAFWQMVAVVLIAAMRQGGPLMAWTVCTVMLFCIVYGLFGR